MVANITAFKFTLLESDSVTPPAEATCLELAGTDHGVEQILARTVKLSDGRLQNLTGDQCSSEKFPIEGLRSGINKSARINTRSN